MRTFDVETGEIEDDNNGQEKPPAVRTVSFGMSSPASRPALGCLPIMGLTFIGLKLLGFLQWPWWLVLAPFWVPVAFYVLVLLFVLILFVYTKKYPPSNFRD